MSAGQKGSFFTSAADSHIHTQGLHFLDKHVEGFRHACIQGVVSLHDAFIDASTSLYIIRFNRQDFLQSVSGAISFQCPDFHFSEALSTVLSFTAQRLLSYQRIGSHSTSMNLISHQVVQFHHIDVTNDHFLIELLTGSTINQMSLSMLRQTCLVQEGTNLFFGNTVKNRSLKMQPQFFGSPTQVSLQYLPHIHSRRHAQRIQNDIHRLTIGEEGHILLRHDFGHHTFITVTTGHLITNRELALGGDVNFDGFYDTRIHILSGLNLPKFIFILRANFFELLVEPAHDFVNLVADRRRIDLNQIMNRRQFTQKRLGDLAIGRDNDFTRLAVDHIQRNLFTQKNVAQCLGQLFFEPIHLALVVILDLA